MRILIITAGTGSYYCGSCMRDNTLARALTAERSALKPKSPRSWTLYAHALDGLGDAAGASAARDKAEALLAN